MDRWIEKTDVLIVQLDHRSSHFYEEEPKGKVLCKPMHVYRYFFVKYFGIIVLISGTAG